MKKFVSLALVLTFLLSLMGCDNKDNIPSISEVSQMKYLEVNEALTGKNIQEIRDAWGAPTESDSNEDVWQLDESMLLIIAYNATGVIENCELVCGTPLAPAETIELIESNRTLSLEWLEEVCADSFYDPATVSILDGEWAYSADPDQFVALATVRYTTKDGSYETADFLMRGNFDGNIETFHILNEESPYTRENGLQEFGAVDDQRFPFT